MKKNEGRKSRASVPISRYYSGGSVVTYRNTHLFWMVFCKISAIFLVALTRLTIFIIQESGAAAAAAGARAAELFSCRATWDEGQLSTVDRFS